MDAKTLKKTSKAELAAKLDELQKRFDTLATVAEDAGKNEVNAMFNTSAPNASIKTRKVAVVHELIFEHPEGFTLKVRVNEEEAGIDHFLDLDKQAVTIYNPHAFKKYRDRRLAEGKDKLDPLYQVDKDVFIARQVLTTGRGRSFTKSR